MASDRTVRRRRLLALGGSVLASLAGCPGANETETTTGTGRDTMGTTEVATATTTASATESGRGFVDDFSENRLSSYRPVTGSLDPWSVTAQIDDGSALVDTTDDGAEALLAPPPAPLTWPGTGTVGVDIQFGTGSTFRNCKVGLGDVPAGSSTYVQVTPRQIAVSAPNGDFRQRFPDIGDHGVHRLEIELGDEQITAAVDDDYRIELRVDEPLPAGTVAFGIEASPTGTGGKTWFDNLEIRPSR